MKENRWTSFFESVVVAAILLVLVQTFLEDFAVVSGWKWSIRRALVFSGFGFDFFFTIEFLTRLYFAFLRRKAFHYIVHERGWVDFFASIPLLLLNSGPTVLSLLFGVSLVGGIGGFMNVLKVVKAIRIARILRLLRVLKLLRQIKNTDSSMAQRHVGKVSTIGVSVYVFVILGFSVLDAFVTLPTLSDVAQQEPQRIVQFVESSRLAAAGNETLLARYAASQPTLLLVKEGDDIRYSRFDNQYYAAHFGPMDYTHVRSDGTEYYFDLRPLNADQSLSNLVYFAVIVILVLMFLLYYGPHFALTVSDPVHIMRRGMGESGYNLEARIPERYETDEVFQLAQLYNSSYLPMKDRSGHNDESGVLDLKIDDIKSFFAE